RRMMRVVTRARAAAAQPAPDASPALIVVMPLLIGCAALLAAPSPVRAAPGRAAHACRAR
ncbi:hypothetical protein ACX84U_17035, partial [Burkholderia pseudomallei]